jgi:hypothetical protein
MARPEIFELPTNRFEVEYSPHQPLLQCRLSYPGLRLSGPEYISIFSCQSFFRSNRLSCFACRLSCSRYCHSSLVEFIKSMPHLLLFLTSDYFMLNMQMFQQNLLEGLSQKTQWLLPCRRKHTKRNFTHFKQFSW